LFGLVMLIAGTVAAAIAAVTLGASLLQVTPPQWEPIARPFGYGLAVATAVGALQRCLTGYCIRSGRFLLMGWAQFLFCLVTVIAQLSLVTVVRPLPALIWGHVWAPVRQRLGASVWRTAWPTRRIRCSTVPSPRSSTASPVAATRSQLAASPPDWWRRPSSCW